MKKYILYIFISSWSLFYGCKEFIEPSITERKVILTAPGNGVESGIYNQTFWWEPVEDALTYRLQIVSPTFDSISLLVVDTLVTTNKFILTLDPGKYAWRVRAENGSSQSLYSASSFTIHESSIEAQQIRTVSPSVNFLTNQKEVVYKWQKLFGSSEYRLQIDTNNFDDEKALVYDDVTPNLEVSVPLTKEKLYQWRVRGEAADVQSKWSAVNKITFDITPPVKVVLNSPAQNGTVEKPVNLKWEAVSDAKKYELTVLQSDSTTVYNSSFPAITTTTNFNFNLGTLQEKIFWKVRAIDEAGNKGEYSNLRNFTVQ